MGLISMYRVLVTGANGQLGSELRHLVAVTSLPEYDFQFMTREELDLSDISNIENFFDSKKFDVIINCAAYTAVDKAETEQELADSINHRFVSILSRVAKRDGTKLILISTDYVFDGKGYRPYVENDPTDPQGVYGQSKCNGEKAVFEIAPQNTLIIRTSWVYSSFGNNFVKTMLRLGKEREELGVIFDQVGTPTYARDLAAAILEILPKIDNTSPQIYHYSNEGVVSWYDFARAIFELSGITCDVNPITTDQYPTPAQRPHYSLLNKAKIKSDYGISIPYWRESLEMCLIELGEVE